MRPRRRWSPLARPLSRDLADIATLHKLLSYWSVRLVTVAEGEISDLHVGLKGTMNALYLKDLAQKTHRGLEGRVREGHSGGGLCFGYDLVPGQAGELRIDAAKAAIVRRIFEEYAAGRSPRAIATRLNQEGVPGPSGQRWRDTTIRGHIIRGTGILNNELYIGKRVWNRLHYVKDPVSSRRRSRLNPPELWVVDEVPDLRIIDDELWDAVKARQKTIRESKGVQGAQDPLLGAAPGPAPAHRAGPLRQLWQPHGLGWQGLPGLLRRPRPGHVLEPQGRPPEPARGADPGRP